MSDHTIKNNPWIEKMLVVSTGHISPQDERLLHYKVYPYSCLARDEGYILYINEEEPISISNSEDFITEIKMHDNLKRFSPEFRKILKIAQEKECIWVMFDRDGQIYDDLKEFDW